MARPVRATSLSGLLLGRHAVGEQKKEKLKISQTRVAQQNHELVLKTS
jgi:hypothetical protein